MSKHIAWITVLKRAWPPYGYYDDYKLARVQEMLEARKPNSALLEAYAIQDDTKRMEALKVIANAVKKEQIIALYADGGVIGRNPSSVGGTWAWRHVNANGEPVAEESGVITVAEAKVGFVTNNLTELLALVNGIEALPAGWRGTVYSDSNISLGRLFRGWALNEVPQWLIERMGAAMRHVDIEHSREVLLDGHPTKAQLEAGTGKRGNPVSIHNVWCDEACGEQARQHVDARKAEQGRMAL